MTSQSRRQQQVPYERRKLETQKKTISLKNYLFLHFLSNHLQIFTEIVLLDFKKISAINLF